MPTKLDRCATKWMIKGQSITYKTPRLHPDDCSVWNNLKRITIVFECYSTKSIMFYFCYWYSPVRLTILLLRIFEMFNESLVYVNTVAHNSQLVMTTNTFALKKRFTTQNVSCLADRLVWFKWCTFIDLASHPTFDGFSGLWNLDAGDGVYVRWGVTPPI